MKLRQSFVANSSSSSFYIAVDKDEDAYCRFTYEEDNKKHTINLTEHYEYNDEEYDNIKEIMGIRLNNQYLFNYTPNNYEEIYEMLLKLINLFMTYEYDEDEFYNKIYEQQKAFEVCNADQLIVKLIKYLSKCYLDWIKEEVDNNPDIDKKDLTYQDFKEVIKLVYQSRKIEDKIWDLSNYKELNNLTEVEFYQSLRMRDALHNAFVYCRYYINLLVYLYKYNKKIQEIWIGHDGECDDEYSQSVYDSYCDNRRFEDANFEVLNIAYY